MLEKNKVQHIGNVILGAGLTGLSAAYYGNGVIFEREKEVGGTCRSSRLDGYTFDLGIHVLHTKNKHVLKLFSRNSGVNLQSKRRSAWIYSNNILTKYPFQVNTFGLPKKITRECLLGFIDTLHNKGRLFTNYRDWIYAAFGKGIAENFYIPYSEKFWTIETSKLTTEWLDVRVPRPSLEQVIKGAFTVSEEEFGPNSEFLYPSDGGIQKITQALIKRNSKIYLNKTAKKISVNEKVIYFADGSTFSYDKLISTIPLPELVSILELVPEAVKNAANRLKYNSVLCVNFGVRREEITSKHWIYFPEDKFAPFRISFPKNFSSSTVPKGWSSIQAEISYSKDRPVRYRDVAEKVIKDLIAAKIIRASDMIKLINIDDIKYAYVIYDHKRKANLKTINDFLNKLDIISIGRYGGWEYLWMDEAILSGKNINFKAKE